MAAVTPEQPDGDARDYLRLRSKWKADCRVAERQGWPLPPEPARPAFATETATPDPLTPPAPPTPLPFLTTADTIPAALGPATRVNDGVRRANAAALTIAADRGSNDGRPGISIDAALCVLLAIVHESDPDGTADASRPLIAELTGLSIDQVKRAVGHLAAAGLAVRVSKPGQYGVWLLPDHLVGAVVTDAVTRALRVRLLPRPTGPVSKQMGRARLRRVLVAVACNVNHADEMWHSAARLAADLYGFNAREVEKALYKLRTAGLIIPTGRVGNSIRYRLGF